MVAISLYKGNLHKAMAVSHRWPCPTPKLSRKDFKILIRRRDRALSRLATDMATICNQNPAPAPDPSPNSDNLDPRPASEDGRGKRGREEEKATVKDEILVEDCSGKLAEKSDALDVLEEEKDVQNAMNVDVSNAPGNDVVENINIENATSDAEKRRKEVKDKLEILNEKKHSLVQVLKQILNAEEQLKRRNSMQGVSTHPPSALQLDNTTDSGSMVRVNTPRTGKDGNPCGDMEGGEADDISKDSTHSRHLPRASSTSPSSDSQQRKPVLNTVPHSYRATLGVAGSPSRFAPAAQGPPSVSVSGASYIASSPSPAASGGTSVFRDNRLPSPWN